MHDGRETIETYPLSLLWWQPLSRIGNNIIQTGVLIEVACAEINLAKLADTLVISVASNQTTLELIVRIERSNAYSFGSLFS